ncbi:alpha/beta fold hydrolase [Streptomyces sp. 7N604]|uniref:alpha/beta fold hydrolase n=1 Tax=Streptomyces sp. 7N604 TaxID=3457415 RepID=UPI003FD00E8D
MPDEYADHRRTVGGISLTDVGEGPVTLFVHGVFTNGRLWRNAVRLLSDRRRCICVDLPGHGHTPPMGEPSVWGLADAVDTVIRELDLREVHLVGNDTGGAVAQVVLARNVDRFASFTLTNCDTEGNFPPPMFKPAVWAAKVRLLRAAGPVARVPFLAKQLYRTGYQKPMSLPDDVVTDYVRPIFGNRAGTLFMERLLASMAPDQLSDIREQLSACEVPTLLVWGTGDFFFKLEWARWLQRLIPGATDIVEVPGGRLFYVDERAEELVAALENHWK